MKIHALLLSTCLVVTASACGDPAETCDPTPGTICTIAGSGANGYFGDDGPALDAELSLPQDALAAPDGSLYILDWNNHRIRSLGTDGVIRHIAGRGELGGGLDDPANGDFNHPTGLIFGPNGDTLIIAAWHNSKIRTLDIDTLEIIDTCGDGRRTYFGDEGPALTASLDLPASVVLAANDDLVIMDQANQVIRRVDSEGIIHRIAGQCVVEPPGGCGETVLAACPGGSGKMTCDPGLCSMPCTPAFAGEGEDALAIRMAQPFGQSASPAGRMVYDDAGNLYFADTDNDLVRKISEDGVVTTVAGVLPVNGDTQGGYTGDGGPATEARLSGPVDLALGDDGTLYISDVDNHCIRAVDPAGIITTAVGVCGERGYEGDGGPATEALLKLPYGIEYASGTLYVADTGNNVIRSVVVP